MLAFAVLLLPLVAWDRALSRRDGAVLLAAYAAYVVWLLRQAE
jgi:Ca2+/Na+ antiporter